MPEDAMPETPDTGSEEERSDRPDRAGPDDDDPQGMRGQLDDSMDGLEADDDLDEAARGIPQNVETTSDAARPDEPR